MHPKLALWMELLFKIRVGKQVVVINDLKEHSDIRHARTRLKNFEIWRFSKSLILYPEGYHFIPADEFEGLDGTAPDLREEYAQRELGAALRNWLMTHRDSRIFFLHDGDEFWKLTCQLADAESTSSLTLQELGNIFNLETGEKEDQKVEYPRRLRDFLDNLSPEEENKLVDFVSTGGLDAK